MDKKDLISIKEDLAKFEEWFQSIGNSPLSKYERAIINTYIAAKLLDKFTGPLSLSAPTSS